MLSIFKNPKIRKFSLVVGLPALAITGLLSFSGAADTRATQKDMSDVKMKSTSGSVIRTSDLKKAKAALKANGLRELNVAQLPNGDSLITVNAKASSASAKAVEKAMAHDAKFKLSPNYRYQPTSLPNDPLFTDGSQWNLTKMEAPAGWNTTTGSSDVTIAVIDSGVLSSQSWSNSSECTDTSPCDLADFPDDKIWTNVGETGPTTSEGSAPNCTSRGLTLDKSCNNLDDDSNGYIDDNRGWDFMGGWRGNGDVCPNYTDASTYNDPYYNGYVYADNDPQPYSCDSPNYPNELNKHHYNGSCTMFESACYTNHGTAAASAATSATNNGAITAGVDWNAKVMPLRAMDAYGWTDSAHITAAVEYATAMGADVVNISLAVFNNGSCNVTDTLLEPALEKAANAGVVIAAAAGNGGSQGVCFPAMSKHTIAVGASDRDDNRASFSTYGPELDVIAPGLELALAIAPSKSSNNYRDYSLTAYGTSFASPQVAGLAVLVKSLNPNLSAQEVKTAIQRGATKVAGMNGSHFTYEHGYGRANVRATVEQDLTTLNSISYRSFSAPIDMKLTTDTQKTDLLSGQLTGPVIGRNTVLSFSSEAYVNGVLYYRTTDDTTAGNDLGIPASNLREAPTKGGGPRK